MKTAIFLSIREKATRFPKKVLKEIKGKTVTEHLIDRLKTSEEADEIILKIKSFAEIENDLITLISSKKMDPNISSILRLILDNPRRILEYSQNIADVTLNRTIEDSIETPSYAV